jgi:ammonium transporter, Amt family
VRPAETGRRTNKEVWALKSITGLFDPSAIRGKMPSILKRAGVKTLVLTVVAMALMTGLAFGGDPTGAATGDINAVAAATAGAPTTAAVGAALGHLTIGVNMFFVIMGVMLIFFMQAGFMMVETGFCRAKNSAHVAMTNFIVFGVGAITYWLVGFAVQFGGFGSIALLGGVEPLDKMIALAPGFGLLGAKGFMVGSLGDGTYDVGIFAFFLFQLVFMDTAATIVTGAMAERWKFSAFMPMGVFMAAVVYPIYGMWVWGGGWLSQLGTTMSLGHGALDFAGSSVVHMVGGFSALAGALVIGPRIGKYKKDGTPIAIPGHHIPMAIAGTIILFFGWFGFNGMSTLAAGDLRFSIIIGNTLLAGCAGMLTSLFVVWKMWGKPDPSMAVNGSLAGLVAITAPCAFVAPWAAIVIGGIAGVLVVYSVIFIERVLKIDDPVGASSVHGVNGAWGMIALGLFADGTYGDGFNGIKGAVTGLFYGGGAGQLFAQLISVAVAAAWAFGLFYVFFTIQKKLGSLRSSAADEIAGLDATEMGVLGYADFVTTSPATDGLGAHPAGQEV